MRRGLSAVLAVTAGSLALPVWVGTSTTSATAATSDERCNTVSTKLVDDPAALANLADTGFDQARRFATGRGVVVAVVDSGVNTGNPHLRDVVDGTSFVGGSGTTDAQGHGTAIAGIIGARKVKGSVLVGAAPDATLLSVRVNVLQKEVKTADVAAGIRWAAEQDAVDVINVSISTGPSDPQLPALKRAVAYAVKQDIVVVAAAGNARENEPYTQVQYPAGFPGVIGVAASTPRGGVDNWSIHGEHVDVSAPGSNVLTSFFGNGDCLVGLDHAYTSYAAPYVSALAAQLRERFPKDSAAEIAHRITATADRPRITQRNDREGWGRIQPVAALTSSDAARNGPRKTSDTQTAAQGIPTTEAEGDPMSGPRTRLLWWGLGATALLSVALVARPLSARRR